LLVVERSGKPIESRPVTTVRAPCDRIDKLFGVGVFIGAICAAEVKALHICSGAARKIAQQIARGGCGCLRKPAASRGGDLGDDAANEQLARGIERPSRTADQ